MAPRDLIRIARRHATGDGRRGRPRQTDLCRSASAAYYAMFHTLARCSADMVAGATRARRSQPAWEQTYRALEHGHAKNQCRNGAVMRQFPPAIQDFARYFVDMQGLRHYADYAPVTNLDRSQVLHLQVLHLVDETERITAQFSNTPASDRRAFAIYALFRLRRY